MKTPNSEHTRWVLPLPAFIFKPFTLIIISSVHLYLSTGHLYQFFSGEITWTNIWKGFGALLGAYVFAALASKQFAGKEDELSKVKKLGTLQSSQ
jgi:hypothetical protein